MSQAAYRAAAVTFLSDFATDADIGLQVYPGRPRTLRPPSAFVDTINTTYTPFVGLIDQATPEVLVTVIFGLFDSLDAVTQRDSFVDDFHQWVADKYHQAGANTLIRVSELRDVPDYVPEWLPPEQQRTYYAVQITLEGFETV